MAEGEVSSRNLLLYGALAFIAFYIITHLLFNVFFTIEFTEEKIDNTYSLIGFLGIPIALAIIVVHLFNITNHIAQIVVSIIIGGITVFAGFIIMFAGMCLWVTTDTLYYNKAGSSTIVLRDYGCGATDSTSPIVKAFKHFNILGILNAYTEVDTNQLDKNQWLRVKSK